MISTRLILLAGSLSLSGALIGCDDQAAQTAKARAALDEAVVLFAEAQQGYATGEAASYASFRQAKLAEAEAKLQSVADRSSDKLAKSGAHRLLAGVKSSRARDTAEGAAAAFSQINRQSTSLFNQLAAAQHIDALILARTDDGGAVVKALEEGLALVRESKAGVNSALGELAEQRAAATRKAEQFKAQVDGHLTRAQEFEEQSQAAPNGEVEQQVNTQRYLAQLDAQAAQRQAEEQAIEAQLAADRMASMQLENDIWDKMAAQLTELKQRVETEGVDAARDVSSAGSERVIALDDVQGQIDELAARFASEVNGPLAAAAAEIRESIEQFDRASGLADRDDKQTLSFEQVGVKVELAAVLSRHAGFTDEFAQMLDAVLENPAVASSPNADALRNQQLGFVGQAQALKAQVGEVITDGLAQSESMIGPHEIGQASESLAQALRAYGAQIN